MHPPLSEQEDIPHDPTMIVTHTRNAAGEQRVYLGGKGSLECWIEPDQTSGHWRVRVDEAVAGNRLTVPDKQAWVRYMLTELANLLDVPIDQLPVVSLSDIAALHVSDPCTGRRAKAPAQRRREANFVAVHEDRSNVANQAPRFSRQKSRA